MARITRKTIQAVKDTVKISDVFEWLGTTVTHRGRNTMAFCPFCEDANSKNPGCSLDDDRGLFHCFAAGTLVITDMGTLPIEELVGKRVQILNGDGKWELVEFKCYGQQRLYRIDLFDGKKDRRIYATGGHRWFVENHVGDVRTRDLEVGSCLVNTFDTDYLGRIIPTQYVMSVMRTDMIEDVYCCQTSTGSFTLEGYILTGNCFVCNSSGDLISAVQQHEECSFPEAVELIADQFNVPVEYEEASDPEAESRRRKLVHVLEAAQQEFIAQREDSHFEAFLKERNLTWEAAERFELGMSLYTTADAVTAKLEKEFGKKALVDAGLCFEDDNGNLVLRFKNRITFPIRTAPGTLVAFGGRDLTGRAQAKYKNSPESEIFKKRNVMYGMNTAKRAMSKTRRAIVCEGYMDTIALQTHGFEYTVGAMGTALTAYNLNRLSNFADTIYIATDSDKAGIAAAMRTAETIPQNFASQVRVLAIPEVVCNDEAEVRATSKNKAEEYLWTEDGAGNRIPVTFPVKVPMAKDPDEFFNQVGHSPEEFEKIIRESKDIFLFCAMTLVRPYVETIDAEIAREMTDATIISKAKQDAKREVARWLAKVYNKTNIYQRQNIANYMISALRLVDTFEQMEGEWRHGANSVANGYSQEVEDIHPRQPVFNSALTKEEDLLIATLYFHPESRKVIKENVANIESVFTSPVRKSVFDKINAAYGKGATTKEVGNDLDDNETRELARIVMAEQAKGSSSSELSPDTIVGICRKVETHAIENMIEQESQSASPDVMKIISMKMQLATLQGQA